MMPSPLTLNKHILKTKRKITSCKKKLRYSKELKVQIEAKEELSGLESKLLYFEQSLILEQAKYDVRRTEGIERPGGNESLVSTIPKGTTMGDRVAGGQTKGGIETCPF